MDIALAVFAVAVLVIAGIAAGPAGALALLLTFLTARYLFTARRLGFDRAWITLGFTPAAPLWQRGNWRWLGNMIDGSDSFWKAASVATTLTALSLMLPPFEVGVVAVVVATCYVAEIARLAPRLVASNDEGPVVVRVIAAAKTPEPLAPAAPASPVPSAAPTRAPRRPRQPPKPRRPRKIRQRAKPRRKRSYPQPLFASRRPELPSKSRPLRKPAPRRPPLRNGRPTRQPPRLATHRPALKLRPRKPGS